MVLPHLRDEYLLTRHFRLAIQMVPYESVTCKKFVSKTSKVAVRNDGFVDPKCLVDRNTGVGDTVCYAMLKRMTPACHDAKVAFVRELHSIRFCE